MGLFDRFKRVVKANVNQLINKAEDPEKILNQLVEEMNKQLVASKKSVASAMADEKLLERRTKEHRRKAEEWEKRAVLALRASEREPERKEYYEDLARKALSQKRDHNATADKYEEQHVAQKESVEKLKFALQDLQNRIEESQRKKNLLIARARRAETQKKIQDQISGLVDTSAFQAFEKMANKVEQIEAETEAVANLDAPVLDNLEQEFTLLENPNDDKKMLDDLRKKMKNGDTEKPSAPPTPPPPNVSDPEVDMMMDELKRKLEE